MLVKNERITMEDKIKEYFKKWQKTGEGRTNEIMAKDIAEIAEKEYATNQGFTDLMIKNTNLKDEIKHWQDSWDVLTKDNAELKEQIKYLDGVSMLNEDLIRKNDELEQQNAELLEEVKGRDGIIGRVIDGRDKLKQQIDRLHKNEIIYHKRLKDRDIDVYSKDGEIINDKDNI